MWGWSSAWPRPCQWWLKGSCWLTSSSAPSRYQSCSPMQTVGGEPTDALHSVEVIQVPHAAALPRVAGHGEVSSHPGDGPLQHVVRAGGRQHWAEPLSTSADGCGDVPRGDDPRPDARGGHAAGAGESRLVAPRAVGFLIAFPIVGREPPGLGVDLGADALRFVKREDGELRVAVVAADHVAVRPRPGAVAGLDLHALQPASIFLDERQIAARLAGAERHRLQRHRVGLVELAAAEEVERFLDLGVPRLDAGVQQRQRTQRSDAALVLGHLVPLAARRLLVEQVLAAASDRVADLFGGDLGALRLGGGAIGQPGRGGKQHGDDEQMRDDSHGRFLPRRATGNSMTAMFIVDCAGCVNNARPRRRALHCPALGRPIESGRNRRPALPWTRKARPCLHPDATLATFCRSFGSIGT